MSKVNPWDNQYPDQNQPQLVNDYTDQAEVEADNNNNGEIDDDDDGSDEANEEGGDEGDGVDDANDDDKDVETHGAAKKTLSSTQHSKKKPDESSKKREERLAYSNESMQKLVDLYKRIDGFVHDIRQRVIHKKKTKSLTVNEILKYFCFTDAVSYGRYTTSVEKAFCNGASYNHNPVMKYFREEIRKFITYVHSHKGKSVYTTLKANEQILSEFTTAFFKAFLDFFDTNRRNNNKPRGRKTKKKVVLNKLNRIVLSMTDLTSKLVSTHGNCNVHHIKKTQNEKKINDPFF